MINLYYLIFLIITELCGCVFAIYDINISNTTCIISDRKEKEKCNIITDFIDYKNNSKKNSLNISNDLPLKVALCAIGKNENLYIREWVEWYKNIGVSKIFLYDNNELDGERFEDVINEYIDSGFVEIIDRRGIIKTRIIENDGMTTQGTAYTNCYHNNYKEYDWMFFFDIDEFISIDYKYKDIFEFLNDFNEYDGIKVQWRMYGDNGNLYYENKPVIERFKNDNNVGYSRYFKTILKCKKYNYTLLFNPHSILNKEPHIVNILKREVKNIYRDDTLSKPYKKLPIYLDHFFTKSTEEFIKKKYMKTDAAFGGKSRKSKNFSLEKLKFKYFQYNKITKEKQNMFDSLEEIKS